MANVLINRLHNCNVYMDGANLLGRAAEIELPQIKTKMVDHKALGMVGTIQAFAGFDVLTGKITWASLYQDALKVTANIFKTVQLQARGSIENWTTPNGRNSEVPYVAMMRVAFTSFPLGNFKQHENVEVSTDYQAYSIKVTIDGQDIIEVDVLANIYKAGGQDMLATYRSNIGA